MWAEPLPETGRRRGPRPIAVALSGHKSLMVKTVLALFQGLVAAAGLSFFGYSAASAAMESGFDLQRPLNVAIIMRAATGGEPLFEIGLYRSRAGRYRMTDRYSFDRHCRLRRLPDIWVANNRLIALRSIPQTSLIGGNPSAGRVWARASARYISWQYTGVFGRSPQNLDLCLRRYWRQLADKIAPEKSNSISG